MAARGGYYASERIFPKHATAISALDGDTLQIDNGAIVRLIGIDAPDRGQEGNKAARRRMINWVMAKEGYAKVVIYEDRRKLIYQDYLGSAEK